MYGWNIQYVQRESFLLPLVRHHSYKNEQHAIQGCNTPSRKCTAYSWRIQPIFVQYSLQPIISFERGQKLCRACNKSFKHVLVFLHFHKGTVHNSLQKAELFSRCMIFSKKNVQYTAIFSGSTFLKFQLRFHVQSALIPCKCATFYSTRQRF